MAWLQTAAPLPAAAKPPTSLGTSLGMRSLAMASPSPSVPKQPFLSPQPPLTFEP